MSAPAKGLPNSRRSGKAAARTWDAGQVMGAIPANTLADGLLPAEAGARPRWRGTMVCRRLNRSAR